MKKLDSIRYLKNYPPHIYQGDEKDTKVLIELIRNDLEMKNEKKK